MRILADENVRASLIRALRDAGFDILSVRESRPSISDEEVLALAVQEQRLLITEDIGFGELVFKYQFKSTSVMLIRFPGIDPYEQINIVHSFLGKKLDLDNHFVVLTKEQFRIRKIKSTD